MSLTDKVIKNTFYHILSQVIGFIFPFILTPYIISVIGIEQFGIYALVLGFLGTFGLFDMSLSTSFIKFISEHYNKKEYSELNNVINTGMFFYAAFSLIVLIVGYVFSKFFLSFINIPNGLEEIALFSLRISLVIFFIANTTTIFVSVLISIQKMYINSLAGIIINTLNFISIFILLYLGYGLKGMLYSQLAAVFVSVSMNYYLSKREMPVLKISYRHLNTSSFKKMFSFGIQMQVSRFSGFLSEKYDELLLGYFSVLSNVAFFNLAGRIYRLGRFLPTQVFQQVAPVAAELNAKNESKKLDKLFIDATKYLTIISLPIFIYLFVFADLVFLTWMGPGYELSAYLLRVLAIGQIVNLMISAPGNSIIPNLGVPKYLMYEGIISLSINIFLSFLLIKYYGIVGAAIGNTISIIISSMYIYYSSAKYFKLNIIKYSIDLYMIPMIVSILASFVVYFAYHFTFYNFYTPVNRVSGIINMAVTGICFTFIYSYSLYKFKYLDKHDRDNISKLKNLILFKKDKPLQIFSGE